MLMNFFSEHAANEFKTHNVDFTLRFLCQTADWLVRSSVLLGMDETVENES